MGNVKYSNIQIPEIEIEDIEPVIYFNDIKCPNCKLTLSVEDIEVKHLSTGVEHGKIKTIAGARCNCQYCRTKFTVEKTIKSEFSKGIFIHWLCVIFAWASFFSIVLNCIGVGIAKGLKSSLWKFFGINCLIFLGIFIIAAIIGIALETWNDDCVRHNIK